MSDFHVHLLDANAAIASPPIIAAPPPIIAIPSNAPKKNYNLKKGH